MKVRMLALLFFTLCLGAITAQAEAAGTLVWVDSTRDIYINQELDRAAQVLRCDSPPCLALSSPAVASQGWTWAQDQQQMATYFTPREFDGVMGLMSPAGYEAKGEEMVRVPAGEFRARQFLRRTEKGESAWWLHPELGVPVRGRASGGLEYILTSLEISPTGR
jgi:hypothetical protein